MNDDRTTTIRKGVIVGCHIRADTKERFWGNWNEPDAEEKFALQLQRRCKEFNEFIRDHRSQDDISLHIERETRDECAACHEEWEPDNADGVTRCAWCGAALVPDSNDAKAGAE